MRHRVVRTDPEADAFDPDEPLYYATYGEWTKNAGFSRARPGDAPEALIWDDAAYGSFFAGLTKAADADVYAFRRERFDDSPDFHVAGPDLSDARRSPAPTPSRTTTPGGARSSSTTRTSGGGLCRAS